MQIRQVLKNQLLPLKAGYDRRTGPVLSILIHSTNNPRGNTDFESEVDFLYRSRNVGADYLVGSEEVVQFFNSKNFYAYHAGETRTPKYSNKNSIGVEVHYSPADKAPASIETINNLSKLVRQLLKEYKLTVDDISLHRLEAVPIGRKEDPSFWSNEQFYIWRDTLMKTQTFTVLQETFIYTSPEFKEIARHITSGDIKAGVMPVGYEFDGQWINNNKAIWIANGWGFVPPYITEADTILNGPMVDQIKLYRALNQWAKHLTQEEKDSIVSAYCTYGELTTIGNLRPFAQAAKETAWFSSERWIKSNNPAGLGATNDGKWGSHFTNISEGVLAQYAHLLCYATKSNELSYILERIAQLSPRIKEMSDKFGRGSAVTWINLNGKWAFPGEGYGESIIKIGEKIRNL